MNWEQLIAIARLLAESPRHGEARGRPQQARLRKAISAAYYAVFHALANSNADTLIGASPQFRSLPAWTQTYRALGHGFAKGQIQRGSDAFPTAIQDFANTFVALQDERHRADYDPDAEFTRFYTVYWINRAEAAITNFTAATVSERKSFAAQVLFRNR